MPDVNISPEHVELVRSNENWTKVSSSRLTALWEDLKANLPAEPLKVGDRARQYRNEEHPIVDVLAIDGDQVFVRYEFSGNIYHSVRHLIDLERV
jgi:hypothetical protein